MYGGQDLNLSVYLYLLLCRNASLVFSYSTVSPIHSINYATSDT